MPTAYLVTNLMLTKSVPSTTQSLCLPKRGLGSHFTHALLYIIQSIKSLFGRILVLFLCFHSIRSHCYGQLYWLCFCNWVTSANNIANRELLRVLRERIHMYKGCCCCTLFSEKRLLACFGVRFMPTICLVNRARHFPSTLSPRNCTARSLRPTAAINGWKTGQQLVLNGMQNY